MHRYKSLPTKALADIGLIERPDRADPLTTDSPALAVLTDFTEQQPLMLEQSTPLDEAIALMKRTHARLKLVIDARETFRGIISLADLLSLKVMRASQDTGLGRNDLVVGDIMTPRSSLHAVDYGDLARARIGDLLATMQDFGDHYVLVVDGERRSVRGIVAANDISRGLHIPVQIGERANSFSDIYRAVRV
ncbi:CBS domain-containing protein [Mangrovimicrobium sediminis]|uniref:CBS domain-containing protein n=1 Tax=Mangrovimicrobium sediminis TaxID=2562682 RepID=A0A4Z0M0G9_9GAMM|nr:CBS domain-containing protein [Haliea sp. SAOS-164]TGD73031.1 CBS domain-containing protein [Haliea sp. SAOS-164]